MSTKTNDSPLPKSRDAVVSSSQFCTDASAEAGLSNEPYQLSFDDYDPAWAKKLEKKYGISPPFSDT